MSKIEVASLLVVAALAGCGNGVPVLHCNNDSQCVLNGVHGMCVEPNGVCAIPSASCPSGWVFDKSAGGLAGECIPATDDMGTPDMGMDGGGGTDMPMPDMTGGGTKTQGSACTSDGECVGGFCTDGVCCASRCDGQCQQCIVGTGYCVTVTSGQPVGDRPACTNANKMCGGSCSAANPMTCTYPTISCRDPSCTGGTATLAASCDGVGHCPDAVTQTCSPYICGTNACKTNCQSVNDCVAGDQCNGDGTCTPVSPQLIAPLSTATVTSRRPTLHWLLPVGATTPVVDICPTRACATTIATVTVAGSGTSGTPTTDLPTGIVFWRVRATIGSGSGTSSIWEFSVGPRTASTANTSWGTILDVNGDGYADLAISALNAASGNGKVYVFHGTATGLSTTPASVITGTGGQFGRSVASAGDINGDGYADLIVGANAANNTGAAYVYLGGPTGLGATPSPASTLQPTASVYALFGLSVASAGDVNGDGYADIIVGAPSTPIPGNTMYPQIKGAFYIYLGGANGLGAQPALPPAVQLSAANGGTSFANTVMSADMDGDGYSDVIVTDPGAPFNKTNGSQGPGQAFVYRGSASGLTAAPTVISSPDTTNVGFGSALAVGDFNGDGYADLSVASPGPNNAGAIYSYLGGTSISTTPAATWGTIVGGASNLGLGLTLVAADFDGNGFDDLAAGAANGFDGAVYVFMAGSTGGLSTTGVSPNDPAGTNGHFGWNNSLSRGPDFDGDGKQDLVVGANCTMFSSGNCNGPGAVYVYTGGASGITSNQMPVATWGTLTSSDGANAQFGFAVY